MKTQYNTKELLLALTTMTNKVREFGKQNGEFEVLINTLFHSFSYYDENDKRRLPSVSTLSNATGISTTKLKQMIETMYFSLIDKEGQNPVALTFNKTSVEFYLGGYHDERCAFKTKLDFVPRKGENIQVDYFRPLLGTNLFYVHEVTHRFEDQEHIVLLYLRHGMYNSYMDLRVDQGIATGELNWNYFQLTEEELKEKMKLSKNPWG